MGARYPFVVAAESTDLTGYGSPVMSTAESTLAVDSRERVVLSVEPDQLTAIFGRRVRVQITNPSPQDRAVTLRPTAGKGIELRLRSDPIDVPAGRTVTVRGRVRVRRPRVFGTVQAHAYALAARGQGAPVVVEGTVRARPLLRGSLVKSVAVVLVVAVWAALGIIAIPRIAAFFTSSASTSETATGAADGAGAAVRNGRGDSGGGRRCGRRWCRCRWSGSRRCGCRRCGGRRWRRCRRAGAARHRHRPGTRPGCRHPGADQPERGGRGGRRTRPRHRRANRVGAAGRGFGVRQDPVVGGAAGQRQGPAERQHARPATTGPSRWPASRHPACIC